MKANVEVLMDQLQERAVLALRPYPPVDLPHLCSRVGGLPNLRAGTDWPRAVDGTPLHFLAQIDCTKLPEVRGSLPDKGLLQFFARVDEEMIWDGDPANYVRVLYSEAGGELTTPPDDLPPISGGWHSFDRDMGLPGEPLTRIYPHWPLEFHSIRSWPPNPKIDSSSGVRSEDYYVAVERARAAEIVRTTGRPTNPLAAQQPPWGKYNHDRDGQRMITFPEQEYGSASFPQAWIIVERIARFVAHQTTKEIEKLRNASGSSAEQRPAHECAKLLAKFHDLFIQARAWVERAQAAGLNAPTTEAAASEFTDWIAPLSRSDRLEISGLIWLALTKGMSSSVKYCGGSAKAAAAVPIAYMNYLEEQHSPTCSESFGIRVQAPTRRIFTRHHQLLGHSPTSQDIGARAADDVLLLHLVSDAGVDFMFCDAGEIQFWINADDLKARRLDRVRANTQGG